MDVVNTIIRGFRDADAKRRNEMLDIVAVALILIQLLYMTVQR